MSCAAPGTLCNRSMTTTWLFKRKQRVTIKIHGLPEISHQYHESKRRVGKYIENMKEKTESEARIWHEEEERNKVEAAKEAENKAKEEKDTVRIKKAAYLKTRL